MGLGKSALPVPILPYVGRPLDKEYVIKKFFSYFATKTYVMVVSKESSQGDDSFEHPNKCLD